VAGSANIGRHFGRRMRMDSGDMMFVWAVIAAMVVFAATLFSVSWITNSRK
jgi:hypothetical protein